MIEDASNCKDAVVIGGGFYGCAIATYLVKCRGFKKVVLVEREPSILSRASYHNQARVHNGYHYPRSFTTAYRSRVNLPRFIHDWPDAISKDFTKLYAIARRSSKVTARQFERFCREIGASLKIADKATKSLFESSLIEQIYQVEEFAFDASKLAVWAMHELEGLGIQLRLESTCRTVDKVIDSKLSKVTVCGNNTVETFLSRYVFNCTYSGLNQLLGDFPRSASPLKHELTEMALVQMPDALSHLGVTVMDGPFFSMMPFPSMKLHTLSHVRYTPHSSWNDCIGKNPYTLLNNYDCISRANWMLRDVERYIPAIKGARYVESLFEIKTVLVKNEGDDGRPILFERHGPVPGCYSILGGKIDNIYDVFEKLDAEHFALS